MNTLKNAQNSKTFSRFILSFLCGLLIITIIQKILPDSQGELVQLEVNDYIIAYNGHKIPNIRRLIGYVKKYKAEEYLSIVIVRDERTLEFTLGGGLIGVQIITIPIDFAILESYYRDLGI